MKREEAIAMLVEITTPVVIMLPELSSYIVHGAHKVATDIRNGRAQRCSEHLLTSMRVAIRAHRGCSGGGECPSMVVLRHANAMRWIALSVHHRETAN